jgi:hypothetical protein
MSIHTEQSEQKSNKQPPQMKTIQQFIDEHKITMKSERISSRTDLAADQWDKEAFHFLITIQYNDRDYEFPYSMGSGHKVLKPWSELAGWRKFYSNTLGMSGTKKDYERLADQFYKPRRQYEVELRALMYHAPEPKLADVLNCLALDYSCYINSRSFEDWASELGYDPDSRKAEKIYGAVRDSALNIEQLLGRKLANELAFECESL